MHSYPCDRCGEEATIHEFCGSSAQVDAEVHLCESCAESLGIDAHSGLSVSEALKQIVITKATSGEKAAGVKCPTCGLRWSQFREKSLLGCADCFTAFERRLALLLSRIHEGADRHIGKAGRAPIEGPASRLAELRRELRGVLDEEQYERAAEIRDEIARIDPTNRGRANGGDGP